MLVLQSHDRYDDVLVLDCASNSMSFHSKRGSPELAARPVRGHFTREGGDLVLFYRRDGSLHLRAGEKDVALEPGTSVELRNDTTRGTRTLSVVRDGRAVLQWAHKPVEIRPPLEEDPTPFVEREQFDFALFIENVLNDPQRRERIYR